MKPKSPEALATAIERLSGDSRLHDGLGRTGQANVRKHYNPARMAQVTLSILADQISTGTTTAQR